MEDEKHPVTQREAVYGLHPSLHGARDTFAAPLVARCTRESWAGMMEMVRYTDIVSNKKVVERSREVVPLRRAVSTASI